MNIKGKNIAKAIFAIGCVMYLIVYNHSVWAFAVIAFLVWLTWFIDSEKIRSIVISQKKVQLDMQATAKQVNVTAERFDQVVNSFSEISAESLIAQGRFSASVPWRTGANFVTNAKQIAQDSERGSSMMLKVVRAEQKIIELFGNDLTAEFPEVKDQIKAAIQREDYVEHGWVRYPDWPTYIDLQQLNSLDDKIEPKHLVQWHKEINEFTEFYNKCVKDV